jgi:hypothetical protein
MSAKPKIFTDTAGRSLRRDDVKFLAARNMDGSSDAGTIHNDYELLEWATDAYGEFLVPQVEHYGLAFLPADMQGARREDLTY